MSRSAALTACTVSMPSSLAARMMRTAISPRLAMNSLRIAMASALDIVERLAGHHSILVFDMKGDELAGFFRDDGGERLHHFDQTHRLADSDRITLLLERRLAGGGRAVERAGDGCLNGFDGH